MTRALPPAPRCPTSREVVQAFAAHLRTRTLRLGEGDRYEREVEEFLRRSPAVHDDPAPAHLPPLTPDP